MVSLQGDALTVVAGSEKGGMALLMVMAFMALAVPLVTSMLGLALHRPDS